MGSLGELKGCPAEGSVDEGASFVLALLQWCSPSQVAGYIVPVIFFAVDGVFG